MLRLRPMSNTPSSSVQQQNRRSWNAVTAAHQSHKRDQAAFFRDGGTTLFPDELELLGDLTGQRLVHLQCNCGQDSVSLAGLGATVTGVDISDAALAEAEALATAVGLDIAWHRSDVVAWMEETEERFDVAFASYGTIGWLPDVNAWARGAHRVVAPGGRLILMEFHPLVWSFDGTGRIIEPYFIDGAIDDKEGVNDYIANSSDGLTPMGWQSGVVDFSNPEPAVAFQHTVAQTLQALISAGWSLEVVREYPYANGCCLFEGMEPLPDRRFGMPPGVPSMPLMWSVVARR